MAKKKDNTVSVLAFEKKLVPSDGYLFGTTWDDRKSSSTPLKIVEKSVRGTISNRPSKTIKNDPVKLDAEVQKPNLQTVDNCALATDQDTLHLKFTLKILGGVQKPSACNNPDFLSSYSKVAEDYIEEEGFRELAKRYATNLANGRFFWRNRVGSEKLEVEVKVLNHGEEQSWSFNALEMNLRDFSENDISNELAEKIADALSDKRDFLLLEINAYALVGKAQEVYPSEELVLNKGRGDKSKVLYQVDDIAALHSQKIGNALRTIDTWYPDYEDIGIGPIAAEVYGSVTNLGKAYRTPKAKADFYSLFDQFAWGEKLPSKEDEHFVMSVLVRGGVFGESSKD